MTGVDGVFHLAGWFKSTPKVVTLPESFNAAGLRIARATFIGDNSKAVRELGYRVRPLEEGLQETVMHLMKELKLPL